MDKIIIFATILFQGEVKNLQYKAINFKTEKECYAHMTKHDEHINYYKTHLLRVELFRSKKEIQVLRFCASSRCYSYHWPTGGPIYQND